MKLLFNISKIFEWEIKILNTNFAFISKGIPSILINDDIKVFKFLSLSIFKNEFKILLISSSFKLFLTNNFEYIVGSIKLSNDSIFSKKKLFEFTFKLEIFSLKLYWFKLFNSL